MKSALISVLFAILLAGNAAADTAGWRATPWVEAPHSKLRLLLGPAEGGQLRAGVEIVLEPGFHTYWRSPGDSGVPPTPDFKGSKNVDGPALEFPAPVAFPDGTGGTSWGYEERVIFPLKARFNAAGSYRLVLNLDFAVCGTLCIPAHAELLAGSEAPFEPAPEAAALLRSFEAKVPVRVAPGETGPGGLSLRLVGTERDGNGLRLLVAADAPSQPQPALFGESSGFIETKEQKEVGERAVTFVLRADPAPGSGGRFGRALLTLAAAEIAIEVEVDLDAAAAKP